MSTYEYLCNLRDTGHKTNPERIVCAANVFKDGTAAREGQQRPIVYGLVVYEVNDDGPHMRCSV